VLDSDHVFGAEAVAGADDGGFLTDGAEIGAVETALLEEPAAALVTCRTRFI